MRCPASFPQIELDLAAFPRVDPERNAREIPQRFGQRQSLCHYTVKDNKVSGLGASVTIQYTLLLPRPLKQYICYRLWLFHWTVTNLDNSTERMAQRV